MTTATESLQGPGDNDLTEITVLLGMKPKEFRIVQKTFLTSLADKLQCNFNDLTIVSIRPGCTKVTIRLSPRLAAELLKLANTSGEDGHEFREEFSVRSAHYSEHLILIRRKGREFTWLHISDAHFEEGAGPHGGSQARVKQALLDDLSNMLDPHGLVPDAVFVTGDIAQSGKSSEYEEALKFLNVLKTRLPNPDAPVMVVPGNHDVDRDVVSRFHTEEEAAISTLKSNENVIDYWTCSKFKSDRDRVLERLKNYFEFSRKCGKLGQPPLNHGYFYTTKLHHDGISIGVAGLNSAWRCGSDGDRGRLFLGVPQIDAGLGDMDDSDVRIAILHHPPDSDWFDRSDALYQRNKISGFDFILRGHEHDPHGISMSQLGTATSFRFAAGALYTHEHYPKSVSAMRVNFDGGSARLFYWRLSSGKIEWVPDVDFHRDGSVQFPLSDRLKLRIANRK